MMYLPMLLGAQLLGTALACGLNLYATIAVLGLAARFDVIAELPAGMRGLENGVVIGAALALYAVGFLAGRVRYLDTTWEAVHTVIRPLAAGLLALLALQDASPAVRAAAVTGAVVAALAAHGTKAGLRLMLLTRPGGSRGARTAAGVLEDTAAVALVLAVLLYPGAAVPVAGGALLVLLLAGPGVWRAALLGLRGVLARLRGFFGRRGWRERSRLPRRLRSLVPVEPLGHAPPRAIAATARGLPGVHAYRHGVLVFGAGAPRFVYRARFRTRAVTLPAWSGASLRRGVIVDLLMLDAPAQSSASSERPTFFLLQDGPAPELVAAELAAACASATGTAGATGSAADTATAGATGGAAAGAVPAAALLDAAERV
jgi:hypothetical protein